MKKVSLKDIFTGNMPPPPPPRITVQNLTHDKKTNFSINNSIMSIRQHILEEIKHLPAVQQIEIIESIGKELRQKNSIKINTRQRKMNLDAERPDLETMKA